MNITENISEAVTETTPVRVTEIDKYGRAYATGRRKLSSARVWIKRGTGKFTINKKNIESYFRCINDRYKVISAFLATKSQDKFDVFCTVSGGGTTGQSGAILHSIAKALVNYDPSHLPVLRNMGAITRDSRMVESKKYGQHKARKKTQFSKR